MPKSRNSRETANARLYLSPEPFALRDAPQAVVLNVSR
jgi:hypothetical protein